ncbi:diguanylate cyclase domain-containing protein [Anabaena sp. UHCC 0451]|uniref:diguanylate cyclase domain-containing protein n=1 Tax=Anabaena sp. UHCC 0451 TaxID=2055235 RepID=UPI002B218A6E|nr:diguanylate cyclase [Anabaena sp. UHCC 0451]MEA5575804.1 diguanylate cyclase [Anabaena sp. UHCC 0451]
MKKIASEYKANLLVVDDHPDNLRVLSAILGQEGYKVRKAISAEVALNTVKVEIPDLILLDIKMPKIDGYTICAVLKQNDATRDIPVIFLSALDTTADRVKGFEVGGVDYITKPFQAEDVLARIKHQLTIVRQRQELYEHNQNLIKEIQYRKQIESKLKLLLTTINLVSQAPNLDHAIEAVLREVCRTINWDYGEAWITKPDNTGLQLGHAYYNCYDQELTRFHQASLAYSFPYGFKLIGRVWSTQETEWIEDISQVQENVFSRIKLVQDTGLKTVFAVPITIEGRVLVIMCLFQRSSLLYNPELVELVSAVALELSGFIGRKKTEEALKQANKELLRLANIDGLTGIANRRCFDKSLSREWLRLKREESPLTLLLSDIDYFKLYNDYYGHQAGDECLRRIAKAIAESCKRPADLVARYGGEEFAILLPNTDLDGAIYITQQIQQEIASMAIPHQCSDVSNQVTLSIGLVSMIPTNETSREIMIAAADKALYQAKDQGRNTYCIYHSQE